MVSITRLLPVLALLATSFAMPQEYDYSSPSAPAPIPAEAAAAVPPAGQEAAPSHDPSAAALASAAPSAHTTIPYNEPKLHSIVWNAWSASSSTPAVATGSVLAEAAGAAPTPAVVQGTGATPTDLGSCMQVCQAAFGPSSPSAPPAQSAVAGVPTSSALASPSVPAGAGVTHTIIVAPTAGVLRFVPFSVNADIGDSLHFLWGAGPHTVTTSSGLNICNKSSTVEAFDSGKLNATSQYIVKVNTTSPRFHYCTVGMHCANGMYGVVNPPTTNVTANITATRTTAVAGAGSTAGAGSSGCNDARMDCWVANWAASSPEASATVKAVSKACEGTDAWKWGAGLDMSSMLGEGVSKQNVIENVMYTRLMMSLNPSLLTPADQPPAPLPAQWVAAPDLKTFVQQSQLAPAAGNSPSSGASPAGGASGAVDAAAAGTAMSGAGRTAAPVVLSVLIAGMAVLIS